ncbi:MAG: MFS transporter [Steroidobacteraceae bacterium]|jgi:MFS family permease
MTSDAPAPQPKFVAIGPAVIPLLALGIFINYVDRGNLATAAPLIKDQLHLSSTQIGLLLSAFFWSYVPAQILAGWLAEHLNPYRTLAIGSALWSIATAASGLASGFYSLIALRVLLGLGESAAFPCSSKLLAHHLSLDRLGGANGLITTGNALGPAFGTFVGGLLIAQIGWRSLFILFGLGSLLWLVPWHVSTRHVSAHADLRPGEQGPSFALILRRREIWGASLGQFCYAYAFYFVISWLPLYLIKAGGLSIGQMAQLGGLIYLVFAVSTYSIGWLSDRWIRAGASVNRARKTLTISGHVIIAASLAAAAVGDLRVSVISLFCAGFAFGMTTPNMFAIGQTLAGPRTAGKWMGVQNCVANLAGVVAPVITGLVVDRTGHYYWAFVIAAAVATAGIIGWGLLIRKVEPLDWATANEAIGAYGEERSVILLRGCSRP